MATSASWELQKGIYQTLAGDTSITGLLGGTNIYDDAPQSADYPYLTFGQSIARDWSTGTEDGLEHILTLHVWSRAGGKKETHEIIEAIRKRSCAGELAPRILRSEARPRRRDLSWDRAVPGGYRAAGGLIRIATAQVISISTI